MKLELPPDSAAFVEDEVRRGAFSSPEEVVIAALKAYRADSAFGDFAPGELDQLLEEGERSGDQVGWYEQHHAGEELESRLQQRTRRQP